MSDHPHIIQNQLQLLFVGVCIFLLREYVVGVLEDINIRNFNEFIARKRFKAFDFRRTNLTNITVKDENIIFSITDLSKDSIIISRSVLDSNNYTIVPPLGLSID